MKKALILLLFIASISSLFSQRKDNEARLLSYPNTSATEITFSYAGDIFTVPITGGLARRITTSPGVELFPRFSPDGQQIAFIGNYDGNQDIYIIPNTGGEPTRVTYGVDIPNLPERMGPDKIIMQWTKDGKKILYRGRQDSWNSLVGKLYYVSTSGSLPEELPLPRSGFACLSPDGSKLAYNRIFREFRAWKRYRGGQADDIWIYDFNTKQLQNITDNPAQDIIPMWIGNKIYFLSDRDKIMNLYEYNLSTKETKKITNFTDYDIKFPSLGDKYISFSNGGYIYVLNTDDDQYQKVPISINEDFPATRNEIINVKDYIENREISPDGSAALFAARGDIFVVPATQGNIINLTKSNGVHDRNPKWSPDGQWIAFISDKTGEDEIYIIKPDGTGLTQITNDAKSYRWEIEWSPDGQYILNSDKAMNLYLINVLTKKSQVIAHSKLWEIRDFSFSPDSKWVTFSDLGDNQFSQINLYNILSSKTYQLTSKFFNSNQPTWDPKGRYLYFVSDRYFDATSGSFEYNYVFQDMQNMFALTLQDNEQNPFAEFTTDIKSDVDSNLTPAKAEKGKKKKEEVNDKIIQVDLDKIADRIFEFPTVHGNYYGIYAFDDKVYYARSSVSSKPTLYYFDLKEKNENEIGNVSMYAISKDGKKILSMKGSDYYINKLPAKLDYKEGKLNLDKLQLYLDRKAEWKQIFTEAWRQMKYFFYDPNMHGNDWNAIYKKYEQMLPYVNHRVDLTFLISEMIAELNIGHAYVGGGDMPKVTAVKVGLLGARYKYEPKSGYYQIAKIFEGRNWDESTRSPLTEPGLKVKEGDYIIAIDNEPLSYENHPDKALNNKANMFVKLTINDKPSKEGAWDIYVKTISEEDGLVYLNWVENNRKYVDKATNGRIGYIQIPDMEFDNGLREFAKYYYPQLNKEGLIIDDRYNGGGNVSPLIIERLRREIGLAEHARNQEDINVKPDGVMAGPLVCLINQLSMSDGDLFPYQFRKYKLGTLIGMRSWGGVIGIRGSLPFTDGSYMYKPEFANFGADGNWIIEGTGVKPDIEVENDPATEYSGKDQQLDKAIQVVLEEIKTNTKQQKPIAVPPFPKK